MMEEINLINQTFLDAEKPCWRTHWGAIVRLVPQMKAFIKYGQKEGGNFPKQKADYFQKNGQGNYFPMSSTTFLRWERLAKWPELQQMAARGELIGEIIMRPIYQLDEAKANQGKFIHTFSMLTY